MKTQLDLLTKVGAGIDDTGVFLEMYVEDPSEELLAEAEGALSAAERTLEKMEFERMMSGKHDRAAAFIAINAGAGGTESQDWAEMLLRMYLRYCERQGWKVEVTDELGGDTAGIKSATLRVEGDHAFGYLKAENGVHRLVRISPFDANKRRQTSFASVSVLPEVDDSIEIEINEGDLRVDTYRSSAAPVASTSTRRTPPFASPTSDGGTVVACQAERSQHKNRSTAMKLLKAKLYELELQKRNDERDALYAGKAKIDFGSQIRSYVLHPYQMVKDLRTGWQTSDTRGFLDGDLTAAVQAFLLMHAGEAPQARDVARRRLKSDVLARIPTRKPIVHRVIHRAPRCAPRMAGAVTAVARLRRTHARPLGAVQVIEINHKDDMYANQPTRNLTLLTCPVEAVRRDCDNDTCGFAGRARCLAGCRACTSPGRSRCLIPAGHAATVRRSLAGGPAMEDTIISQRKAKADALRALGDHPYANDFTVAHLTAEAVLTEHAEKTAEVLEATPLAGGRSPAASWRCAGWVRWSSSFCSTAARADPGQPFSERAARRLTSHGSSCSTSATSSASSGVMMRTRKGELSVKANRFRILTKTLRPLPEKWHGLTDVAVRYRQRYVDLIVNDDVRRTFQARSRIVSYIRRFFEDRDYLEVETPMLQSLYGGAAARPFVTHHNALDMKLFLRIAPELNLKRLVVGGLHRVFELNKNFRNEGVSTQHNPEFTALEFYEAFATYEDLMALTETLLEGLALHLHGKTKIALTESTTLEFARPVPPPVGLPGARRARRHPRRGGRDDRDVLLAAAARLRDRQDRQDAARLPADGGLRGGGGAPAHPADVRHGLPARRLAALAKEGLESAARRPLRALRRRSRDRQCFQ
jgi:peptide chain release factor 2